ncbi:unnamed protein product [Effrenium voratum]|nr:unnamed protein product [Effrenium voratum]
MIPGRFALLLLLTANAFVASAKPDCKDGSCLMNTTGPLLLQGRQHLKLNLQVQAECSTSSEDCRATGCCQDSEFRCFEKNEFWAGCRESCQPGETSPLDDPEYQTPWTCTLIGSTPTPSPTPTPTPTPSPPSPTPTPVNGDVFVTGSAGSGKARLFEFIDALTDQPVAGSAARAVHSSGGAAGGVVSESQGYGLLLSGALLASLDEGDQDRQRIMDYTHQMFLGWRRMCELSAGSGSCQDDEGFQCGGGQYPCLAHWKFDDSLAYAIGSGSAPDGDADALAGMLLAVLALERASSPPSWLEEVGQWAYDTCKQFHMSSTVPSSSGNHRIVKLGACWGGWGSNGQNPSYHAPAVYRMCRNYMKTHDSMFGGSAQEGDGYEAEWNKLIATTYKMFEATQCDSNGLVPNWAKVFEEGSALRAETGFSGSGTPGPEYGAEASRATWRVALDYLLFPNEAGDAVGFLDPLASHLETRESGGNWAESLTIDGSCLVNSVHSSWSQNMFMAGPTFTCLVCPANSVDAGRQQELIDAAGTRVASKAIDDYYSGSWVAISTITLNGDLVRAAQGAGLLSSNTATATGTASTTATATTATTATPATTPTTTIATTASPTTTGGQCSLASEDCRTTGCCQDSGFRCFEKNEFWAGCRESCQPGETSPLDDPEYQTPWTCTLIGSTPTPSPTPTPTPTPSPPSPTPTPVNGDVFVTGSAGSGKARLFEFIDALTDQPVAGSAARAVHSSGGAAGGVVSESQGYGLLLSGALLASLDDGDQDRQRIMDYTHQMFLGWRRMCELSAGSGSCQDDEGFQCGGGQYPCLAHWKFDDSLAYAIGSGSAPDGDADALAGMLLAVLALERTSSPPSWLEEVGQWAYDTCKQFHMSSTVPSSSGNHRIVKLGACWGGWGSNGQNPSYHAPAVYRMCRNYMKTHDSMFGGSAQEGDGYEAEWNKLIATTYKMFEATQCDSNGLVPNWAKVFEEGSALRAETGFSGSGTPGPEYGAEASRAIWRVALDYLLFPNEAGDAVGFLDPLASHLETRESGGNWAESLTIDGSCLVNSVHSSWSQNMFMAGPTFTSLVCPANSVDAGRQQELIDAAGTRVASKAINDYYSGSWVAISTITLNGDLVRAAQGAGLLSTTTTTTTSTTTAATTTTTTTTTTTPMGYSRVFEPVDGGSDRACRGSSSSDNSASYYTVVSAPSLAACKDQCAGLSGCAGLEFKGTRCELWTRSILATHPLSGYTCLRYVDPTSLRQGTFQAVDGGENRVCRGASASDNSESYFEVAQGMAVSGCQRLCQLRADCVGVEHHEGGRCELWTRALGIQASKAASGYSCWRFVSDDAPPPPPSRDGSFEAVDGGEGRACRGSGPSDNLQSYYSVAGLPSLQSCQDLCRTSDTCKGVEFSPGRCELWTRTGGIGSSKALEGYSCWRFVEQVAS